MNWLREQMLNLDASPIDLCEGLGDSGRTSLSARRTIRTPVDAHGSLSLRPFGGFQPLELTEAGRDGGARQHCTGFGALSPLNFTATITCSLIDKSLRFNHFSQSCQRADLFLHNTTGKSRWIRSPCPHYDNLRSLTDYTIIRFDFDH